MHELEDEAARQTVEEGPPSAPETPVIAEERPFTKEDVAAVLNALDPFWTRAIAPEGETKAVTA